MLSKASLFSDELASLSEQAKALSHPARLEILKILAEHETCICSEVVEGLPLAQATVSRHLKVLKEAGLIQGEVEGPRVCYCLDREALAHFQEQMAAFFGDVLGASSDARCC